MSPGADGAPPLGPDVPALDLVAARGDDGMTWLARAGRRYPWSLTRAFHHGGGPEGLATVIPQSVAGVVLGGDRVRARAAVGTGAALQLAFAGAEIVQPGRGGAAAETVWEIDAAPGACLEVVRPPTVLRPRARLASRLEVSAAAEATVLWSEAVVWPEGLPFAVELAVRIVAPGGAGLAAARLALTPEAVAAAGGRRGAPRALAQILCLDVRAAGLAEALAAPLTEAASPAYAGVGSLPNGAGLVVSLLGWERDALAPARTAVRDRIWRAVLGLSPPPVRLGAYGPVR